MEKMPSASNSPVMGRKLSGVESSENNSDSKTTKKVPLSVASMVRRFETSNPSKSRGGNGETPSERSPSQKIRDSESSLSSSPSSSQGHLNEIQDLQQTNLGSKSESNSDKKQITATKTNQNKTVSKNLIFITLHSNFLIFSTTRCPLSAVECLETRVKTIKKI